MNPNVQIVVISMFSITLLAVMVAMALWGLLRRTRFQLSFRNTLHAEALERLAKECDKLNRIIRNRDEDLLKLSTLVVKADRERAQIQYQLDRAVMNGDASAHLANYRMQKVLALEDRLAITKLSLAALAVGVIQSVPGSAAEYEEFRKEVNAQLNNCRRVPK